VAISGGASAAITAYATQTSTIYHPTAPLSTKGAALVARNEGLRLVPYFDGAVACTVGVGHLIHYGGCTASDYQHWTLTLPQAMTLLMHDAGRATDCVHQAITSRISVPQDDALIDLVFNAGCGSLRYRGVSDAINRGDLASVPSRLYSTAVTAGGVYLPGLRTRRIAEGILFSRGYYGAGIGYYLPPKPLTAAEKKALAAAAARAKLRTRTGYYSWLAWRLGREDWKPYGKQRRSVRPHVPARVPAAWWGRERAFLAAR
jgi:GH24 family phage-related lysozyme (muramidase)